MKESTLQQVRKDYNKKQKEKEDMLRYKKILEILMKSHDVETLLEVLEKFDLDYDGLSNKIRSKIYSEFEIMSEYKGPSEETMVMSAYNNHPEAFGTENTNSNNIMVFMGSYIKSDTEEDSDCITYSRNPDTSYRTYMDLETGIVETVSKNAVEEFEENNITLFLPISEYSEKAYFHSYVQLQKWFKEQLIHRSQEEAIKEMREKYEIKYKRLQPTFKKIANIQGLPIDEYLKAFGANGFVENHCLPKEQQLVVKLYRKQNNKS